MKIRMSQWPDLLFFRLSAQLVDDFNLKESDLGGGVEAAMEAEAVGRGETGSSGLICEVQFKLNRIPIVEMHSAVDRLPDLNLVYPDVTKDVAIPWTPSR